MNASNLRTLHAIFAHPLQHGIRIHDVEALFTSLGGSVEPLEHHRFKISFSSGEFVWIALGNHSSHTELDGDAVMAEVVWFFWTGPIVNLEAGHRPCEGGSHP